MGIVSSGGRVKCQGPGTLMLRQRYIHPVSRVAAVEDDCQADASGQWPDEDVEKHVVTDLAGRGEVERADGLIITILLVAVAVDLLAAMAREVEEEQIARDGACR